ncbi:MAG: YciI family protein [Actinomycetota bacterium]
MKFMLLIYGDEQAASQATPEQFQAQSDAYDEFTKSIVASGAFLDGDPFQPTSTAKTVQVRDGQTATAPGPFEATKQQLFAYYKVEAADEQQALDLAARIPGAHTGTIEVRPVMTFD